MNSTMEKMRKAHEKQANGIRRKPGFDTVSKAFDVEYAIAKELHKARTKAHLSHVQIKWIRCTSIREMKKISLFLVS